MQFTGGYGVKTRAAHCRRLAPQPPTRDPFCSFPSAGAYRVSSYVDHEYPTYATNSSTVIFTGQRGSYSYDGHDGTDYAMGQGTPVLAAAGGNVTFAGSQTAYCWVTKKNETALGVIIEHPNSHRTLYWHLSAISTTVGSAVTAGQKIASSGNTGCSTGAHLHFSVRRNVSGSYRVTDPYGWQASVAEPCVANNTCAAGEPLWTPPAADPTDPPGTVYADNEDKRLHGDVRLGARGRRGLWRRCTLDAE